MTTTAAGDAAVARLNKATEAFEKIITGASNQVVDVPGYGNQPTLAARVDQRLDETTATAEAEANRSRDEADRATIQANAAANSVTQAAAEFNKARTQADRAQSEADRAAQITGLETVSDAIGMASLPLPDVWAPLSDSLRMITGYGRDVLVGSDVVARMVNFSRNSTATYIGKDGQLKTAAANEPRFEKEGLLIEGASSNLIPTSTAFQAASPGVTYEQLVTPSFPHQITRVIKPAGDGDVRTINAELIAGTVYTASIYIDKNVNPAAKVFYGVNSIAATMVRSGVVVGNLERYSATFTCQVSGPHQIRFGAYNSAFDFVAGCPQIEQLPFPSSYIPTTGAAATRTADKAWIQTAGNIAASPFTVAMEVNFRGVNSTSRYARLFTCGPACYAFFTDTNISGRFNSTSPVTAFSLNPIGRAVSGMVFNGAAAKLFSAKKFGPASAISALTDSDVSGDLILGSTTTLSSSDTLFGHIRDVKIWLRTLTDDQIKAVA